MEEHIERGLDDYLVKSKEKRKSNRRSSVSSAEALKLMHLAVNQDNIDENQLLAQIADCQYNFINTQYNKFKEHEKKAKQLANNSAAALKFDIQFNSDKGEEKNLTEQEKYKRNYAQLDERQKKFLDDSEIGPEVFLEAIKRIRAKHMKGIVVSMKESDTSDLMPKDFFLTKKISRKSFSSSMFMKNKNNSKRGIPNILEEFFES